jgi:type II secretory pathway pseudopilin PulG
MWRGRRPDDGFTLLEALVALSILAGSSASLVSLVAASARAQAAAELDASGALLAENLLARLGRDMPLETGLQSGISPAGLRWTLSVAPFAYAPAADRTSALFLVRVQIRPDKAVQPIIDVRTLRRGRK